MVYINNLKCSGLYSFADKTELEFSDSSLIVGPNNSGKSNIFRVLKLFVDTFSERKRLEDYEIYPTSFAPILEVSLRLSREETERIIDFMSFHPDKQNNSSEFHQYKNYDLLCELLDTIHVKCTWKRGIQEASEPYVQMEFTKCGLKLFALLYSDFRIFNEFPEDEQKMTFPQEMYLTDVLKRITKDDEPKSKISDIFYEIQGGVGLPYLRIDRNTATEDEAKKVIRKLASFTGISLEVHQQLSFTDLFGTILRKGIKFASDRRGFIGPTILDFANLLKMETTSTPNEKSLNFNTLLEQQASAKSLEYDEELKNDGSNLASFLFSLKNSSNYNDRIKFEKIQKAFEKILSSEDLHFDAILKYEIKKQYRPWGDQNRSKPKLPIITIIDKKLDAQFPLNQVGSGLGEVIYLLTLAFGIEDSIILLDEPSSNLHPPLMRALMKILQNQITKNQFIIITHSPELVSFQLFENDVKLFYVRRKTGKSMVKTLDGEMKEWFEKDRNRLKHQIDTRIFFGKCIILTEGESDKNFLSGIADSTDSESNEISMLGNDVIIVSTDGVKNFKKYISLLETFEIPYIGLADADAKTLLQSTSILTKNSIQGPGPVYIIEGGGLEFLLNEINSKAFNDAKNDNSDSKPALAYNFAKNVSKEHPEQLKPFFELLKKSVKLAREEDDAIN